jgi:hypothetical protein
MGGKAYATASAHGQSAAEYLGRLNEFVTRDADPRTGFARLDRSRRVARDLVASERLPPADRSVIHLVE